MKHSDLMEVVVRNLVRTGRCRRSALQAEPSQGQVVRIMRGYALHTRAFAAAENVYQERQIVQLARAVAVQERHDGSLIAGPTALLTHGIEHWQAERLPIYLQVDHANPYNKDLFTHVTTPRGNHIPAVPLKLTILGRARQTTQLQAGVPCVDPLTAGVQSVRLLPDECGFVAFMMATQAVVRTDRWDLEATRSRLAQLQEVCLEECWELPRRARGRARYFTASRHMAHPMDSVFEARMAWLLCTAGLDEYVTQYEMRVAGARYFLDFAFPEFQVAVEPDGRAKFGVTLQEVHEAREALEYRREAIERAGWIVVRVAWGELAVSQALEGRIRSALARAGRR